MSTPLVTLAILNVAQHAADHGLALTGIDTPSDPDGPIVIKIRQHHIDDWLESVETTGDPIVSPLERLTGWELSKYPVLVPSPIGDVHVVLWTLRRATPLTTGLHLVGTDTGPGLGAAS